MATEAARLNKEQTHGKKKEKVCLDITRPSHGRTWEVLWENHLTLKHHFASGFASGIVESDQLSFSIWEIEAESHYNQSNSIFKLKEKTT